MKDYIKPFIEDEEIEIEDICKVSGEPETDYDPENGDFLEL